MEQSKRFSALHLVSIPERVLEALKLSSSTSLDHHVGVSIPERVLEALKLLFMLLYFVF